MVWPILPYFWKILNWGSFPFLISRTAADLTDILNCKEFHLHFYQMLAWIRPLCSAFFASPILLLALTADPRPYSGNTDGNFRPTRTSGSVELLLNSPGGQVGSSLAVNSINNQNGIGGGSDTYTQYYGNGDVLPPNSD